MIQEYAKCFVLFWLIVCSSESHAANIYESKTPYDTPSVHIEGAIEKGDLEKIKKVSRDIAARNHEINITLNSPGGDFAEAIKIGKFVQKLNAKTISHGIISNRLSTEPVRCYSACFLIFVAGSSRDPEDNVYLPSTKNEKSIPVLGIHRPYVKRTAYAELSLEKAQALYKKVEDATRKYLLELNVPVELIDAMFATSSNDVRLISRNEFRDKIGYDRPFFEEWRISKCGTLTKQEIKDFGAITGDRIFFKKDDYIPDGLSPGYVDYLQKKIKKIDTCKESIVLKHQRKAFGL